MWSKKVLLALIILASFFQIIISSPSQIIKKYGIDPVQKIIAREIDYASQMELVYQPGLRHLGIPAERLLVKAILPGSQHSFTQIAEDLSAGSGFVIIQCSAMDSWHTTKAGQAQLAKIRSKGYRAVIFDGGHHLPTLGLAPDILIVPQMHGYALHSYMRDGMKVKKIIEMAYELELPCIIAVLPRWAVFKEEQALAKLTRTIMEKCGFNQASIEAPPILAEYHMSKYNHKMFIYIDQDYYKNGESLLENINRLGTGEVKKIYLAFDFKKINMLQAQVFAECLGDSLEIATEIVNEPVYLFNAFWGDKSVLSK